jgi:hypothetical protein
MTLKLPTWWIAREIPLIENDWRNIQLYCKDPQAAWQWNDSFYLIRLSPPFAIRYAENSASPLLYIGSGTVKQRWSSHRWWLERLGYYLPGARYEVWITHHPEYKRVEADALSIFLKDKKRLPLMNRKLESAKAGNSSDYDRDYYDEFARADRRYYWSLEPSQKDIKEYFEKGKFEEPQPLPGLD